MERTIKIKTLVSLFCVTSLLLMAGPSCASKDEIRKPSYKTSQSYKKTAARRSSGSSRRYHVVRRGETLYRIARRYGVTVSSVKRVNRIRDVRDIKIGTRLLIPAKSSSNRRSGARRKKRVAKRYTPPPARSSIRLAWPLKKVKVSSRYGIRSSKKHDGVDLSAPRGTPILAAAPGTVIFSDWGPSGYGKIVIVKHNKQYITVYAHNQKNLIRKGQRVSRGQKIATVGKSGRATGYHVHFELRINRKTVDPERYLPRRR
ncbi:hypothetical protein MNBD_NITROSPINAE02-138 [hydrothermal vent metagenome]|uniref:LysM domain-containing protein n=1 Tax=hydrothermal vent metagenome TaxID=652676 RepID=A0A3B1C1H0_9ZZZZ